MKKRTITISLIVLAFVLLIGIGYAGWVISSQDEATADGGNFTAYTVDSSSLTVTTVDDNQVTFGYNTTGFSGTPWLTYTGVNAEDLTAQFTISWSNQVAGATFSLTHEAYRAGATSTVVDLDPKLIAAPTFSTTSSDASISGTVLTLSAASGSATITVAYKWGTCLSDETHANPYLFFNSKEKTGVAPTVTLDSEESYQELASNALDALYDLIYGTANPLDADDLLHFRVVIAKTAA